MGSGAIAGAGAEGIGKEIARYTVGDFMAQGRQLLRRPAPGLEAGFGNMPPLDTAAAQAIAFRHDGSSGNLIIGAPGVGR